jgi:uncharacterized membrane protein SpoIIM required for sporulation
MVNQLFQGGAQSNARAHGIIKSTMTNSIAMSLADKAVIFFLGVVVGVILQYFLYPTIAALTEDSVYPQGIILVLFIVALILIVAAQK